MNLLDFIEKFPDELSCKDKLDLSTKIGQI